MNETLTRYNQWKDALADDPSATAELAGLIDKPEEMHDRFGTDMAFGTGGIRGRMELGSNRLNAVVVSRLAQGLANHINENNCNPLVTIGYDTRRNSTLFAKSMAEVLAANGISVLIFKDAAPTPLLSYVTRSSDASFGFMITASHNPSCDNGVKLYNASGVQLPPDDADKITVQVSKCDCFTDVKRVKFDDAENIEYISDELGEEFIVLSVIDDKSVSDEELSELRLVYTPLDGAGREYVPKALMKLGINPIIVKTQTSKDGEFATCPKPNPEERATWNEAVRYANENDGQLLIATDPDCDRVGVAERLSDGTFRFFTGNEVGMILLHTLLSQRKAAGTLPENPVVVKTVVTTPMTYAIAKAFSAEVVDVLTGFKYIGGILDGLEQSGQLERYVFGFEESMGYLVNTNTRDKDAVSASVFIARLAAKLYSENSSLSAMMDGLYDTYGHYMSHLMSYEYSSDAGSKKADTLISDLSSPDGFTLKNDKVRYHLDYRDGIKTNVKNGTEAKIGLPFTDMISYKFDSGTEISFRPSGTEPKIKVYIATSQEKLEECITAVSGFMGRYFR